MHPLFEKMKKRDAILYSSPVKAVGELSDADKEAMQNLDEIKPSLFSGAIPRPEEGDFLLGIALLGHVHAVCSDFETTGYQVAVHVPEDIRERELHPGSNYRVKFLKNCYAHGDTGISDLGMGKAPAIVVADIYRGKFSLEGQLPEITELEEFGIGRIHFIGQFVIDASDAELFMPGGLVTQLTRPYGEIHKFLTSAEKSGIEVNIVPYRTIQTGEDSGEMF